MKIATWNVNGIRARAAQVCEFLEREKPDVLCLQELKAGIEQVPEQCKTDAYHIYWHGSTLRAYSGVSLHVRKGIAEPAFSHPEFDMESRIVAGRCADLVLASKPIAARVASCVVQREFGTSDHGPVVMTYQ